MLTNLYAVINWNIGKIFMKSKIRKNNWLYLALSKLMAGFLASFTILAFSIAIRGDGRS